MDGAKRRDGQVHDGEWQMEGLARTDLCAESPVIGGRAANNRQLQAPGDELLTDRAACGEVISVARNANSRQHSDRVRQLVHHLDRACSDWTSRLHAATSPNQEARFR